MLERNNKVIITVPSLPASGDTRHIYYNSTNGHYYGWNPVTNQFDDLSSAGSSINVFVQSSSNTKPSSAVKGDELVITSNGQATGGVVTEQWIFDGTDWIQRPNDKSFTVLNTAQTAPTIGAGNTTNLGTIFKDSLGNSYAVDFNGNGILLSVPDIRYSKALFIDPINGLDTNTGSDNAMFKTIAKALTIADNSGYRIVLAPGTYTENPTITQQNLDIVTLAGDIRGNTLISGTVTFSNTASSSGIQGISMTNLTHSGAGNFYAQDVMVSGTVTKSGAGSATFTNCMLQGTGISVTGAGYTNFYEGLLTGLTVNNAAAVVGAVGVKNLAATTVTAGTLGVYNTIGFSATNGGNAITAAAGTNVYLFNSQFLDPTGAATKLTLSGNYSTDDVIFNKTASTLGTIANATPWFDRLGIINPATITTATKALVRDANGVVSEQLFPTGGASIYTGTNTPAATGNTATSLGIASLPAVYVNSVTGIKYYVDSAGASTIIESSNVTFGTTAPTSPSTTAQEGNTYFVTPDGTSTTIPTSMYVYDKTSDKWVAVPIGGATTKTTTSLTPQYGNGTTHVNAIASAAATVADVIKLSDGSLVNNEDVVTWTGHGLAIHNWYYLSSTTAGGYTTTPPSSPNLVQRLFYTQDANTVKIQVQEAVATDTGSGNVMFKGRWTAATTINNTNIVSNLTNIQINNTPTAWNNATGTFTAPTSAYYIVSVSLGASATLAAGNFLEVQLLKNGVIENSFLDQTFSAGNANLTASGSVLVYLAAGNTLQFRVGNNVAMLTHVNSTHFSIIQQ